MSTNSVGGVPGSVWASGPGLAGAPGTTGTIGLSQGAAPAAGVGAGGQTGPSFSGMLAQAIDQVNALSNQADALAVEYAAGGPVSIDQLMIAQQEATLAVDLVVQVRDRAVNAYQSLMNMQV